MNLEDKYLLINLDTDDLAEQIMRDDNEPYPPTSDEKHIDNLLEEEGLSINSLEGSMATIHNVNNKIYIRFDENNNIYTPTLLEYIERPLFIKFAISFNTPKKVKILDVSPQVGGHIDTNYGIKFKIELTKEKTDAIYENNKPTRKQKEYRKQADIYIRRKFGYSLNDEGYDADINSFLELMRDFYIEGLSQAKYHENNTNDFAIFYTKNKAFHFAQYKEEYYALTEINYIFFIYKVIDNDVYIIADVNDINSAEEAILKYKMKFS